LNPHAR